MRRDQRERACVGSKQASPTAPLPDRRPPLVSLSLELTSKLIATYDGRAQSLSIWKPRSFQPDELVARYELAGKNAVAEQAVDFNAGRTLKASAGGLLAGATFLPVVGTVYGVGRAMKNARAATIRICGDGIDIALETTQKDLATQLVNEINGTVAY